MENISENPVECTSTESEQKEQFDINKYTPDEIQKILSTYWHKKYLNMTPEAKIKLYENNKVYAKNNPEKIRANKRDYYHRHPERFSEYHKKYVLALVPIKCELCEYTSKYKPNIVRHMKTKHTETTDEKPSPEII